MNILVDPKDEHLLVGPRGGCCLNGAGYVMVQGKLLHRLIMNAPKGLDVHHVNGDKLDNRRCNLRVVTHAQNHQLGHNTRSDNSSGARGVTLIRKTGRWQAQITVDRRYVYIGTYSTLEEATMAYQKAKEQFHAR